MQKGLCISLRASLVLGLSFVLLAGSLGCSKSKKDGPKGNHVSGKVTKGGTPLPGGTISFFVAADPKKPSSASEIKRDGTGEFTVDNLQEGVEYKVVVSTEDLKVSGPQIPKDAPAPPKDVGGKGPPPGMGPPQYTPVNVKYHKPESTPLSFKPEKGKNEKNFEVTE